MNKIKPKIAGFCKFSRDEDKENFISIEEQKRIIKDYAKSRNWNLTDNNFYINDNVSGYNFNRPAFSKMMKKVQRGEFDVGIVKDLSRIGRHNGRVLVLIDEFKNMQKNLIAVSKIGGTYDVLNDRGDIIGITTWFNERYVKECSKKTRKNSHNKFKQKNKLNEEYKMLINQKIKGMAYCSNSMQRELIENTYKKLEKKIQAIAYLQKAIRNAEKKSLEEKFEKLKTSLEYFDEIINTKESSRIILQMIIDKIYIHRDKNIRFVLKTDIDKLM